MDKVDMFCHRLNLLILADSRSKWKIAKDAGMSWCGLDLLMKGKRSPSLDTACKLANALGCGIEHFTRERK